MKARRLGTLSPWFARIDDGSAEAVIEISTTMGLSHASATLERNADAQQRGAQQCQIEKSRMDQKPGLSIDHIQRALDGQADTRQRALVNRRPMRSPMRHVVDGRFQRDDPDRAPSRCALRRFVKPRAASATARRRNCDGHMHRSSMARSAVDFVSTRCTSMRDTPPAIGLHVIHGRYEARLRKVLATHRT